MASISNATGKTCCRICSCSASSRQVSGLTHAGQSSTPMRTTVLGRGMVVDVAAVASAPSSVQAAMATSSRMTRIAGNRRRIGGRADIVR